MVQYLHEKDVSQGFTWEGRALLDPLSEETGTEETEKAGREAFLNKPTAVQMFGHDQDAHKFFYCVAIEGYLLLIEEGRN